MDILCKLDLSPLLTFHPFLTLYQMKYISILALLHLLVVLNCCQIGCDTCTVNSQCLYCSLGYHFDNSICKPCYQTCSRCTNNNSNSCYFCKTGYSLFGSSCITCPINCISCGQYSNSSYYCTDCAYGYYKPLLQCIPIPATNTNTSSAIDVMTIIIVIASVIVVVTLSVCVYKCIKRRSQVIAILEVLPPIPAPIYVPINLSFVALIYADKMQWKLDGERIDVFDDCVICQSSPGNCIISCKHTYHPRCIRDWLAKNKTCPMCRKTVDNMVTVICKSCHKSTFYKPLTQVVSLKDKEIECCSFCLGG